MSVPRESLKLLVILALTASCSSGDSTPAATNSTTTSVGVSPSTTVTTDIPTTMVAAEPLAVGLDWIEVAYDEGVFGDSSLSDITAFGSRWVVTGVTGDEGALGVWISDNGIAWSILDAAAFSGSKEDLQMVDGTPKCSHTSVIRPAGTSPGPTVETNGHLLLLGCGESIWTSTDGATWSRATVRTPDYYLPWDTPYTRSISLKVPLVQDIGVSSSGFVAVGRGVYGMELASSGHTATVWRSDDGTNWEMSADNKADFFDWGGWYEAEMDAVVAFGDGWISAGAVRTGVDEGNMTVWTSADGHSYTTLGEDRALGTLLQPGQQGINGMIATSIGLIAVGWDSETSYFNQGYGDRDDVGRAAIWTSTDGATWTRLEAPDAFQSEGYEVATDLVEGGPGLVAVGTGFADPDRWGVVWVSTDGVSWTRVPHERADPPGPLAAIAAGPDGLVAVGGPGVWVSGDFPIAKPSE